MPECGRLHGSVGKKGWNPDREEVPEPSTLDGWGGEGDQEVKPPNPKAMERGC